METVHLFVMLASVAFMAFAVGAQDAAVGAAGATSAGTLGMEVALVLTAIAGTVQALVGFPLYLIELLARVMPVQNLGSPGLQIAAVLSLYLATGLSLLAATFLNRPVAALLALAGAAMGVLIYALPDASLSALGLVVLTAIFAPVLAIGLGFLMFGLFRRLIHNARSRRRGARRVLPFAAALLVLLAGTAVGLAYTRRDAMADTGTFTIFAGALILAFSGIAFLAAWLFVFRRNAWPADTVEGAEGAFTGLANISGIAVGTAGASLQLMAMLVPAIAVVASIEGSFELKSSMMVMTPALVGFALGVIFLGHRVSEASGTGLLQHLTPIQAVSANLSALLVLLLSAVALLPWVGSANTAGSILGAGLARGRKQVRLPAVLFNLLALLLVPLGAGLLALTFVALSHALIE